MRKEAYKIVDQVMNVGGYSQLLINKVIKSDKFNKLDNDLMVNIVYGSIQNYLYLEDLLSNYIDIKKTDKKVISLLVTAIYQIIYLDKVPKYAIFYETVNIAKQEFKNKDKLINAVLRRFEIKEKKFDTKVEQIAYQTSHPIQLVKMIAKHYSVDVAIKFCLDNHDTQKSLNSYRVNTLKISKDKLLENDDFISGNLVKDAILSKKQFVNDDLYKSGLITLQDEASQYVSEFSKVEKGMLVLDMCAAPGSKTTHLAALMENEGEIYAYDLHEHRVNLIKQNIERMGVEIIKAEAYNSLELLKIHKEESFDLVLLDAPCSGLGVIKRKPEIKYKALNNLDEIITLQKDLLNVASKLVKKKGILVYSTCTLNKKENELQIKNFLEENNKEFNNFILEEEKIILGYEYRCDSFYIARMRKEK